MARTTITETRMTRDTAGERPQHTTASDFESESRYWREAHQAQPYVKKEYSYEEYEPAYRYGFDSYGRYGERGWEEAEVELRSGWEKAKGKSKLSWENAKDAARAAWQRVKNAGDALIGDHQRDRRYEP